MLFVFLASPPDFGTPVKYEPKLDNRGMDVRGR